MAGRCPPLILDDTWLGVPFAVAADLEVSDETVGKWRSLSPADRERLLMKSGLHADATQGRQHWNPVHGPAFPLHPELGLYLDCVDENGQAAVCARARHP